jgi:hypothetical protein
VLTEELAGVLEVEDSCLEDPTARAAVAAARKGPPVTRGTVAIDPQSGRGILTLEIEGTVFQFEDSNTLDVENSKGKRKHDKRPATNPKRIRKSRNA